MSSADPLRTDLDLYSKKSKAYLADMAMKARSKTADDNMNQVKPVKLDLEDPLSFWLMQVHPTHFLLCGYV